jgi:hypothetical protein
MSDERARFEVAATMMAAATLAAALARIGSV